MNHNHELEFKTIISKDHYQHLLDNYVLNDNIFFKQIIILIQMIYCYLLSQLS
ncbi:MAG: hypothetical protein ACPGJL_01400 [Acholeplasmataceae bacterium]